MWGCTGETEVGGKGKDRRKDGKKKSQINKREVLLIHMKISALHTIPLKVFFPHVVVSLGTESSEI